MIEGFVAILLVIVVAALLYYFVRKGLVLVINSIVGLIVLFFISAAGIASVKIDLASILICAFGGLPGAVLLIILSIVGVNV